MKLISGAKQRSCSLSTLIKSIGSACDLMCVGEERGDRNTSHTVAMKWKQEKICVKKHK